jgi:hypothetical protein
VIGPPGSAEPCQKSKIDTFDFITADFNAVLKFKVVTAAKFGGRVALWDHKEECGMLKISVVKSPRQCRLVVEGILVEPWVTELLSEYTKAKQHLDGRELVIDVTNLSAISAAGEDALLELIDDHARFHCGVFTKEVLKQLASKRRSK